MKKWEKREVTSNNYVIKLIKTLWEHYGDPVVNTLPFNAGDMGEIPGWEVPHILHGKKKKKKIHKKTLLTLKKKKLCDLHERSWQTSGTK